MAIGAATAAPAAFALQDDPPYPPALTGLRGSPSRLVRIFSGAITAIDAVHRAVQDLLRARGMI